VTEAEVSHAEQCEVSIRIADPGYDIVERFSNAESQLTSFDKIMILRAIAIIAKSDEVSSSEEEQILSSLASASGLTTEELAAV